MTKVSSVFDDLILSLEAFADPKRVAFAERTFPTPRRIIGVSNPNIHLLVRELRTQLKEWQPVDKLSLLQLLIDAGILETQQLAYTYLGKDKKLLKSLTWAELKPLIRHLDNWVVTDVLGCDVIGIAWQAAQIPDNWWHSYLPSKNVYEQRLPLAATTAFNLPSKGGTGDAARTLPVCKAFVDSREPMIYKAVSWALRALIRFAPEKVGDFIDDHPELHPSVLREVERKLATGKK